MPVCVCACALQVQSIKQSNSVLKEKLDSGVDQFRQPEVPAEYKR